MKPNKNLASNIRFFNFLARYYDTFGRNQSKKLYEAVKRKIRKNSRILDAGCGTGSLLEFLSREKSLELHGIDVSPEMLKIAKSKLKKAKLELKPVEELDKKDYFGYILSNDAFHHYSNQNKAMENFYRALKKGGYLIIADFDFGFLFNKIFHYLEPGNRKVYSSSEFRKLFEAHGFKDIRQEKLGWFSVMTMGRK